MDKADMANVEKLVVVDLGRYDHGYVATSDDPDVDGLFVAHETFDGLLKDIPVAISVLMKAIHGREFVVEEKDRADEDVRPIESKRRFTARAA